jgi:hypothetical protein
MAQYFIYLSKRKKLMSCFYREVRKMKKVMMVLLLIVIGWSVILGSAYADERDLSRERKWYRNYSGDGSTSVSSFCMEDHVFVMASGDTNNSLTIIQVYEERNGKLVPKKCN